jgi:CheY-like chemotaxis protein
MPGPDNLRKGECLLLVDDEPSVLEVMSLFLGKLGYEVLTADLPSKALQVVAAEGNRLALMMTDVVMPEMSGVELASKVREQRPKLPVVFFSAHTEGVISGGVRTRFLHKPFSQDSLAEVLDELLGSRHRAEA